MYHLLVHRHGIMPISLNSKDKSITYDNRIDYYIDLNKFAAEIVFSFELPVLLPHISECYCIDSAADSYEIDLLKAPRKLVVAGTRNWITNNTSDIKDYQCGKTLFYTSMVIAVEIKKNELNRVIDMFSEMENDELKKINNILLQNVLEIVLYRYNEKSGGVSFLTPSYKDCKHVNLKLYINHINKKLLRFYYENFHMEIVDDNEHPIQDNEFSNDICNWRYFYNKCKFEICRCDYVDSIISAAISVESYAWHVIRLNCEDEDSINDFSRGDDNEHLSATILYKKLKDAGWLNTTLNKNKLASKVQRVLSPRNKIMHGESSINVSWKTKAEEVFGSLTELYMNLGENINADLFLDDIEHNPNYYIYRDYVIKCYNGFESIKKMKDESLKIINILPEFEFPKVQYIKALFDLNEVEEALSEMRKLFEFSENHSEIALSLYYCFLYKIDIDEAISIYNELSDKNERIYTALAGLYLHKYKNDKNNESNIFVVIDYLKKAKSHNKKYFLPAYIECNLYREMKCSSNEKVLIKAIIDGVYQDYYMPLRMAYYMMLDNNLEQVINYFEIFIQRFREYHYKGLSIDFMTFLYDMNQIKLIYEDIMSFFQMKNYTMNYNKDELKDLFENPLKGIYSVDNQMIFAKGEMPLQNLFYRETLIIPDGCYVYR